MSETSLAFPVLPASPVPPDDVEILKELVRDALEFYPYCDAAGILVGAEGFTPDQRFDAALDLMLEQAERAFTLQAAINFCCTEISDWAEGWNVSDAAIADLNKRLAEI